MRFTEPCGDGGRLTADWVGDERTTRRPSLLFRRSGRVERMGGDCDRSELGSKGLSVESARVWFQKSGLSLSIRSAGHNGTRRMRQRRYSSRSRWCSRAELTRENRGTRGVVLATAEEPRLAGGRRQA
jgi:hypothetical protein